MSDTLVVAPAPPSGPVVLELLPTVVLAQGDRVVQLRDTSAGLMPVVSKAAPQPVAVEPPSRPALVLAGFTGPPGPQGEPGVGGISIVATAVVDLGSPRIVAVADGHAYYPDLTDGVDAQRIAGVTTASASAGATVTIRPSITLTNVMWSWSPGPIYCGPLGTLTQSPPTSGALVEVGRALSTTKVLFFIQRAILR